ncbi:uncharacterized protein LOC135202824 [Macrobrachium nipponense]|uniref:uncharacterized protein LOC135202824 n=1 Tax=Macrobrachium nipponense TaxID=159736 RepID=UPI0030C82F2A
MEDISISSGSNAHSDDAGGNYTSHDQDVRSGRLDKGEDICKDLPEPVGLSRLSTELSLDNMKLEGDVDVIEKERRLSADGKKVSTESKKASVSLNLKRSPSPSGTPHSPSRPSSLLTPTAPPSTTRVIEIATKVIEFVCSEETIDIESLRKAFFTQVLSEIIFSA